MGGCHQKNKFELEILSRVSVEDGHRTFIKNIL